MSGYTKAELEDECVRAGSEIRKLKAENERLLAELTGYRAAKFKLDYVAENERLRAAVVAFGWSCHCGSWFGGECTCEDVPTNEAWAKALLVYREVTT